jgi:hypothetical protein
LKRVVTKVHELSRSEFAPRLWCSAIFSRSKLSVRAEGALTEPARAALRLGEWGDAFEAPPTLFRRIFLAEFLRRSKEFFAVHNKVALDYRLRFKIDVQASRRGKRKKIALAPTAGATSIAKFY